MGADDRVYRIDNGGALLFHATGRRKDAESFSQTVRELASGSDHNSLGNGMRQEYPGLTDEDIYKQVTRLEERLSDPTIDELVDGIRLARKDRDHLKAVLRQRRDYIVEFYRLREQTDLKS